MTDEVAEVFRAVFRLDNDFVLEDAMSYDDVPGWDSVGHMNLVGELESRFNISLEMEEIIDLDSVKSVAELVARKKST